MDAAYSFLASELSEVESIVIAKFDYEENEHADIPAGLDQDVSAARPQAGGQKRACGDPPWAGHGLECSAPPGLGGRGQLRFPRCTSLAHGEGWRQWQRSS